MKFLTQSDIQDTWAYRNTINVFSRFHPGKTPRTIK